MIANDRKRRLFNALLCIVMLLCAGTAWFFHPWAPMTAVSLPVSAVVSDELTPVEQYRLRRNETELRDMAALELLIRSDAAEPDLRADAARMLEALVDARQRQLAIEGALLDSGYGACVAVITGDQLTIVTAQATLTPQDSAMLTELARVHAGIIPSHLRVICAE